MDHIVLAMPHRGRLNLLTGLLQSSPAALFHKIKGGYEIPEEYGAAGDVISHLGARLFFPGHQPRTLKVSPSRVADVVI